MADINFVIPLNRNELLLTTTDNYIVKDIIVPKDLISRLKDAKSALKSEGCEFIIDNFDIYYSVLHHGETLATDIVYKSYEDLHYATQELNRALGFLLDDKDSLNEELKLKYVNMLKMLLYIYVQIVTLLENINESKRQNLNIRGRKKSTKDDQNFSVDKRTILLNINNILEREINIFWDPPVVEESFITMLSEVCYRFLQNPEIKADKDIRIEIFSMIGNLIKNYNHGTTFVIRMVQLIKMHEHLVYCLPDGVQHLVQNYLCKGLIHDFVREVTEWQTDEKYQDGQGARYCALVLSEMAMLMPDLMIPEVMYLNRYLAHDSPTLRNSVLTVITEVILNVLTHHELSEEQKESRDEFLEILFEHTDDVSVHVRSKVMQHWARLQKENAIPLKYQHRVLEKVIDHLYDKGALVRKSAANCVTTFLSHNLFGADLQIKQRAEELAKKQEMLDKVKVQLDELRHSNLKELEEQWNAIVNDLKEVIKTELEKEIEEESDAEDPTENVSDLIRIYLQDGKCLEAFQLCRKFGKNTEVFQQLKDSMGAEATELDLFLTVMRVIFTDANKILAELTNAANSGVKQLTEEDLKQMEALENAVDYLNDTVIFLKLIGTAVEPMSELLETTNISDMTEAIQFFITAYRFNIDNANAGVLEMLKLMQRNEQERKDAVVNAFKAIYLQTDTKNMADHTLTIVSRLIHLLKTVPLNNFDDLQMIISEWTSKGVLDNSVIDMLWQFFTKKISATDEDSRAATELIRMASIGRKTIISRNLKLVTTVAFSERGKNDMLFLASCLNLLAIAGQEKVDITSKTPPFKINSSDHVFKDLTDIFIPKFFEPVEYFNKVIDGTIDFIYRLCAKPEKVCEYIINQIMKTLTTDIQAPTEKEIDRFVIIRLCQLLGSIAVNHLEFLDDTVYKELKRRNNIRDKRKEAKSKENSAKKKNRKSMTASAIINESHLNASLNQTMNDESILEGAQAEDTDAEFILNVLENDTVSGSGGLGKLAYIITEICKRPNVYDDVMVQGSAVIALIRYMLVSSKFCEQNMQLLFTIFEKTIHSEVKCSILVHCSDLLTRFPNEVEPWTPRIYQKLQDPDLSIRKATFFTLANLILRDMILVHGHISEMARCMVDRDEELKNMSKTFFTQLSHKENNLYNVLPDIFSHLINIEDMPQENFRIIMKFLFELIDKTKHMESLVDRFCCKFRLTDDERHCVNITYCLSLLHYNDKALKKLLENFPMYKHLVHNGEIYALFKQIFAACNKHQVGKADLKPIVKEIEEKINSVFEIREDGATPPPKPPPVPKSTRKGRGKAPNAKKRSTRRKNSSDSDDDEDVPVATKKSNKRKDSSNSDDDFAEAEKENTTQRGGAKRTVRSTRKKPPRKIADDSSDSD